MDATARVDCAHAGGKSEKCADWLKDHEHCNGCPGMEPVELASLLRKAIQEVLVDKAAEQGYPEASLGTRIAAFDNILQDFGLDRKSPMTDWTMGPQRVLGEYVESTELLTADDVRDILQFLTRHKGGTILVAVSDGKGGGARSVVCQVLAAMNRLQDPFHPPTRAIRSMLVGASEALVVSLGKASLVAMAPGCLATLVDLTRRIQTQLEPTLAYKVTPVTLVQISFPSKESLDGFDEWCKENGIECTGGLGGLTSSDLSYALVSRSYSRSDAIKVSQYLSGRARGGAE